MTNIALRRTLLVWIPVNLCLFIAAQRWGTDQSLGHFEWVNVLSWAVALAQIVLFWLIRTSSPASLALGTLTYLVQIPSVTIGLQRLNARAGLAVDLRVADASGPLMEVNIVALVFALWCAYAWWLTARARRASDARP